ncbi:hypothetical protein Pyn_37376 [Prunus yedoensis var. nudiflora]|uniref:Uncharacterized protein n=1 Tax=Prunus yedoensis var. nudiflora TaxID=2094558 RepID=A0A314YWI1_PRUYE|nr:hypothetical protein Pyn_37376 [Prunus yedoensis var. nudiflora]
MASISGISSASPTLKRQKPLLKPTSLFTEGLGFRFGFIPRPVEIGRSGFFCVCGSGDLGGVIDGRRGSGQEEGAGEGSACALAAVR